MKQRLLYIFIFLFVVVNKNCYGQKRNNKLIAVLICSFTKQVGCPNKTINLKIVKVNIAATKVKAELLKIAEHKNNAKYNIVKKSINAEESTHCDVVYITTFFSEKIKDVNKIIGTLPALTITEKPDYTKYIACNRFFGDEDIKTKFQLNRLLTESKKLTKSNQLKALQVLEN